MDDLFRYEIRRGGCVRRERRRIREQDTVYEQSWIYAAGPRELITSGVFTCTAIAIYNASMKSGVLAHLAGIWSDDPIDSLEGVVGTFLEHARAEWSHNLNARQQFTDVNGVVAGMAPREANETRQRQQEYSRIKALLMNAGVAVRPTPEAFVNSADTVVEVSFTPDTGRVNLLRYSAQPSIAEYKDRPIESLFLRL